MMNYLTRQEPQSLPLVSSGEQREAFAEGGDPSKQKILKDIKKYVDKKLSKGEVVTLPELNEKFAEGKRREYLYKEALGKKYDKITTLTTIQALFPDISICDKQVFPQDFYNYKEVIYLFIQI